MRGNRRSIRAGGVVATLVAGVLLAALTTEAQAGDWGDPFRISSPATSESGINESAAAADKAGNFLHVWTQMEPFGSGVKLKLFSQVSHADGTNGPIQRVFNPPGDPWISRIAVSKGPGGTGHLAWVEHELVCSPSCVGTDRIRYVTLDAAGKPTAAPNVIATFPSSDGSQMAAVSLDTADNGVTRAAWFTFDASADEGTVSMVVIPAGGTPLAPFHLKQEQNWSSITDLDLESNAAGDTVVAWSSSPGGESRAEGLLAGSDGFIHPVRTLATASGGIEKLQAVIDESDRSTVAFVDHGGGEVRARQIGGDGHALGSGTTLISTPGGGPASLTTNGLAVAPDGTVTLAWAEYGTPPGTNAIRTRNISPAGVPGSINQVVTESASVEVDSAAVARSADGGILAYQRIPASGPEAGIDSILAVELSPAGTAVGATTTFDTVAAPNDTAWTEGLVMAGDDAALSWRHSRNEVDFYGELFGAIRDGTDPEVTLWAPAQITVGQEAVLATQASDRSALSYAWTVNGTPLAATGPLAKHTFPATGVNTVRVEVIDSVGNKTVKEATVDVQALPESPAPPLPPNTTITAKPKKKVKVKTATFRFISSLAGSKFECRLDKAGWTDCKSPRKLKKLKPGKHTFRVRAIKGELIDPTPATYTWTVQKPKKKKRR